MSISFKAGGATAAPRKKHKKAKRPVVKGVPESRRERWKGGIDWPTVVWIVVTHLGALAAPFYFTWKAFGIFAVLSWLTGSIGVCMGYHRQLTHGSFCTYKPIRWFLAFVGGLSGEGSALMWVANHRKHQQPERDVDFDVDGAGVDAEERRCTQTCKHGERAMQRAGHRARVCGSTG